MIYNVKFLLFSEVQHLRNANLGHTVPETWQEYFKFTASRRTHCVFLVLKLQMYTVHKILHIASTCGPRG